MVIWRELHQGGCHKDAVQQTRRNLSYSHPTGRQLRSLYIVSIRLSLEFVCRILKFSSFPTCRVRLQLPTSPICSIIPITHYSYSYKWSELQDKSYWLVIAVLPYSILKAIMSLVVTMPSFSPEKTGPIKLINNFPIED